MHAQTFFRGVDNITKTYKHGSEDFIDELDSEINRNERMQKREAFISLKDHKENFENNPKCRLINPAKSESGKLSKVILDKFNSNLRQKLNSNQCRNTQQVITWFGNINDKDRHSFIPFDIVDFYASISEKILNEALDWASDLATIPDNDISIIKHGRKPLLFGNGKLWTKKDGSNSLFDVTIGSFDGAEICELVGLFILNHLGKEFGKKNIGITRQLPTAINKRIALLSSDEPTFKESTPIYQNALRHSNFDHEFTYAQDASQRTRRNRQRKIIWFNTPFSKNVNTNIGREFLSLIDKHFPP